ncbi:carboxymuconolactone decarboxylase family protein [Colwellia sp. BRX9-1]|jgi:4-carboxymuconolactone decarboxylase|uniref:carboxymuconolactone decarboxylase family protein n=1 Tax=Colwellia sp. BRX9-1 TaxID=2759830 RepID=UPI001C7169ED|nr:carboxymuconolactone decarboxylase family protein [Colwellia sp. BRX9-1]
MTIANNEKTAGEKIRRQVMGDEFVDRALNNADDFSQPMQDYINDHGWGATWQRTELDIKTRSLVTIAMLAALRAPQELKGHIRGALNNGATKEEIREVLLHSAVYCGAPAAQEAFRAAKEVL